MLQMRFNDEDSWGLLACAYCRLPKSVLNHVLLTSYEPGSSAKRSHGDSHFPVGSSSGWKVTSDPFVFRELRMSSTPDRMIVRPEDRQQKAGWR